MALPNFLDFSIDWDQFKEIPHLTLPLKQYSQGMSQEKASQLISPQMLKIKLLWRQSNTKYTEL